MCMFVYVYDKYNAFKNYAQQDICIYSNLNLKHNIKPNHICNNKLV